MRCTYKCTLLTSCKLFDSIRHGAEAGAAVAESTVVLKDLGQTLHNANKLRPKVRTPQTSLILGVGAQCTKSRTEQKEFWAVMKTVLLSVKPLWSAMETASLSVELWR